MDYSTTEQTIDKALVIVMESASVSSNYKPGGNITLFLEHVVSTMTHSDKIEDLWGPEWSMFMVMIADRSHPTVGSEIVMSAIKDVLRRMVGRSATTPTSAIATLTGLSVNEVEVSGSTKQQHVELVVKICNDLSIPTPLEILCMYDALEDAAGPAGAAKLYRFKPDTNKPITEDNVSSMVALMRAKESVVQAGTQAKEAVKQTEQAVSRYQQEVLKIVQTTTDTKQAVKRMEQAGVRYQREAKEANRMTLEAFRVTTQAERGVANATLRQYKESVAVFVEQLTSVPNKR